MRPMRKWGDGMTSSDSRERRSLLWHARKLKKKKCWYCGSNKFLQVHHKNENWRDNSPSNIQTLCRTCHLRLHMSGQLEPKFCSVNNCKRPHKAKGLCVLHWTRLKFGTHVDGRQPIDPCVICGKPHQLGSRGNLCYTHFHKIEKYGDPFAKPAKPTGRPVGSGIIIDTPCRICGKAYDWRLGSRRDLCNTHKHPAKNRNNPGKPCKVCGAPYRGRGDFEGGFSVRDLCIIHWRIKKRYGDPFAKPVGKGFKVPHNT